jgi:hypothetical protein
MISIPFSARNLSRSTPNMAPLKIFSDSNSCNGKYLSFLKPRYSIMRSFKRARRTDFCGDSFQPPRRQDRQGKRPRIELRRFLAFLSLGDLGDLGGFILWASVESCDSLPDFARRVSQPQPFYGHE